MARVHIDPYMGVFYIDGVKYDFDKSKTMYNSDGEKMWFCVKTTPNGVRKFVTHCNGQQLSDWDPKNPLGKCYDPKWTNKKASSYNFKKNTYENDPHRAQNIPRRQQAHWCPPKPPSKAIPIVNPSSKQAVQVGMAIVRPPNWIPPHMRRGESPTADLEHLAVPPHMRRARGESPTPDLAHSATAWVPPHIRAILQPRVQSSESSESSKVSKNVASDFDNSSKTLEPQSTKAPKLVAVDIVDRPWKLHPELVEILKDPIKYNQWLFATRASEFASIDFQPPCVDFHDDEVSNDGVADIRAIIGVDDLNQLRNWNGGWTPAPCDWEERPITLFEDGYKSKYIECDWLESGIPCGPSATIDCKADSFISGKHPISNNVFIAPIVQPGSQPQPDTADFQNENRRLNQTVKVEVAKYVKKLAKEVTRQADFRRAQELRHQELEVLALNPGPSPFSPTIDMYVRPVEIKDAQAIADIYNYYVDNSIIPEDQEHITLAAIKNFINYCKNNKLPLIVAIKGKLPSGKDVQGRPGKNLKIIMPQHETVIGFTSIEHSQVGFSGSNHGLHRFTGDLKVYVHHECTRKGVGSNLLDHLIHILHFAYAFKNGCDFINPNNDPVYETGGSGMWHVLNFRIPSNKKNDSDLPWISGWLRSKFLFLETARLKSWARSSKAQGHCKFLDLVILQAEALQDGEIEGDF